MRRAIESFLILAGLILAALPAPAEAAPKSGGDQAAKAVSESMRRILRADYEADQATLKHEFEALARYAHSPEVGAEAHYWRGFARWRAGMNGWNDGMPPEEITEHTAAAADEFAKAIERDPAFADARAAMAICRATLLFSEQPEPPDKMDRLRQYSSELKRAFDEAPENPRTLWVVGGTYFWTPPDQGGSVDKAVSFYEKGLAAAQRAPAALATSLRPTWGEPELLMSLAYVRLKQPAPDLDAAERYAREALAEVPYWHYVRDLLLKQIGDARAAAAATPAATATPSSSTTPMN